MIVNICGIPHEIIEVEENFSGVCNFGEIDYRGATIKIKKGMNEDIRLETICHEMLHGILTHLGYLDTANDEQFVNAVSNAIFQGFKPNVKLECGKKTEVEDEKR